MLVTVHSFISFKSVLKLFYPYGYMDGQHFDIRFRMIRTRLKGGNEKMEKVEENEENYRNG
jgi:hypothetical protein